MKMKVTCILIFVLAAIPAYAQFDGYNDNFFDKYIVHGNIGNFSFGSNYPVNDSYNTETYFSLLNIGLKNPITGFGFLFTPMQAFQWGEKWQNENNIMQQSDIEAWSLFNVTVYWDLFSLVSDAVNFYAGPFATVNYFFFEDSFTWRRYVFTSGLQLGLRLALNSWFDYNIVSVQVGYRSMDGGNRIYVGGTVDVLGFLAAYIFFLSAQ